MGLKTIASMGSTGTGQELTVQAMSNGRQAYFYAFNFDNMIHPDPEQVPTEKHIKDAQVTLTGMEPGNYLVEYWDTITGELITVNEVQAEADLLRIQLPEFAQDIAAKIKPM